MSEPSEVEKERKEEGRKAIGQERERKKKRERERRRKKKEEEERHATSSSVSGSVKKLNKVRRKGFESFYGAKNYYSTWNSYSTRQHTKNKRRFSDMGHLRD